MGGAVAVVASEVTAAECRHEVSSILSALCPPAILSGLCRLLFRCVCHKMDCKLPKPLLASLDSDEDDQ